LSSVWSGEIVFSRTWTSWPAASAFILSFVFSEEVNQKM
jgi:hypothetical protein